MASHYKSLSVLLSLVCLISLAHSINNGGVTIDLIHRDSPLSPSHDPSQTRFQRLRNAIDRSFFRKSSLLLTLLKSTSKSLDKTTQAPVTNYGGEYLLEYKIGTPPVRQLSVADTGSDLLWIQCEPCTSCYKQDYPPFDPSASKSYRPVSCQSKQCSIVDNPGCGDSNTCQYKVGYGDRSYSQGEVAAETVTLGSAAFPNVVFGCGSNNAGTFRPSGSGILGLGNGEVSIINQKSSSIRGRFSYCLTLDSNATSKISFGNDAVVTGPNVLSTPLVSKDPPTFYYLTLEGLSVGKQRFEYKSSSSSIMQESGEDEGNIIIDSGTTLTYVPSDLYDGIEASLKNAIEATPVEDQQGLFKLCYQSDGEFNSPPITAHFKGADLVLPRKNIFLEVEEGQFCLAIVPSQNLAIFGNLHQAGYLIGYDIPNQQVNFLQTGCTKSH